jgi:hypothetical protein
MGKSNSTTFTGKERRALKNRCIFCTSAVAGYKKFKIVRFTANGILFNV